VLVIGICRGMGQSTDCGGIKQDVGYVRVFVFADPKQKAGATNGNHCKCKKRCVSALGFARELATFMAQLKMMVESGPFGAPRCDSLQME
jgi:hypothetical protein